MGTEERNISERLADAVIAVLGFALAFMPLALWAAWSLTVYYWVLGTGTAAVAVMVVLSRVGSPEPVALPARRPRLSYEFITKLHHMIGKSKSAA